MMLDLAGGQEIALWSVVALGVTAGAVYGFRRGYSDPRGVRLASFVGMSVLAAGAVLWPSGSLGVYLGGDKRIGYVGFLLTPLMVIAAFLPAALVFFALRMLPWTRNVTLTRERVALLFWWRLALCMGIVLASVAAGYYDL